jgi:hypothetical protein
MVSRDGAHAENGRALGDPLYSAQVRSHETRRPRAGERQKSCLDPFLGSGTTLIACEQLGRTCYGMEISPQYCQVIIDRWEKLTGQKAEKVDGD